MRKPIAPYKILTLAALAATLPACQSLPDQIAPDLARPHIPAIPDIPLQDQILGPWAPDWQAMAPKWQPMIRGLAGLQLGDRTPAGLARAEQEAADEIKTGLNVTTFEFTADEIRQHTGPGRIEAQSYTLKKNHPATGTLEIELSSSRGGTPERARLILANDRLTFTGAPEAPSAPYILRRITRQDFQKRQTAAARSKLFRPTTKTTPDYAPPPPHRTPKAAPSPP